MLNLLSAIPAAAAKVEPDRYVGCRTSADDHILAIGLCDYAEAHPLHGSEGSEIIQIEIESGAVDCAGEPKIEGDVAWWPFHLPASA